ncbi:MAG: hypothetical protein M0C28_00850 [Candidatus Moduliflexus flocculans]|nr:hypothetical protein [Candidatus Moduliflexus flocculans]
MSEVGPGLTAALPAAARRSGPRRRPRRARSVPAGRGRPRPDSRSRPLISAAAFSTAFRKTASAAPLSPREEVVDVGGQVGELGVALAVLGEIGEGPGEIGDRRVEAGRVGALDDEGAGLAEGLGHDLDQSAIRLRGAGDVSFPVLTRSAVRALSPTRTGAAKALRLSISESSWRMGKDAPAVPMTSRLASSAGDRARELAGNDDDGVETVGDAVAVLVGVEALRRIQARRGRTPCRRRPRRAAP